MSNGNEAGDASQAVEPATREWREAVSEAVELLEAQLAKLEDDADKEELEALLRLLYLIADQREDAVRPLQELDEAQREFWKELVYGLLVYFDDEETPRDEYRRTLALQSLRRAVDHLATASNLEVRNVTLCTRVDSFGRYQEFPKLEFRSGEEVLLYVEVENFSTEQLASNGLCETALLGRYEIRDLAQQKVAEHQFPVEKDVCRNHRRDFFIPYRMYMPNVPPGRYTLQLTVEDAKSDRSGQSAPLAFAIKE